MSNGNDAELPLVAGGQGRSSEDLTASAWALVVLAGVLLPIIILLIGVTAS